MARIVLHTFGSFGDVNPYVGLGMELRRRGHHPVLAMPGVFQDTVEAAGLEFHAVRPDLDRDDLELAARVMDPARGSAVLFETLLMPHLADSHADLMAAAADADLLVTHPAAVAGPIAAEELGRPWASTVLAPMSFFSIGDPPVPPPVPWLHGLLARSRVASRLFVTVADWETRRWTRPVQRFRRARGLPRGRNPVLGGQHSPYLVLALFSTVLADPQPDWPARTLVTGPVLYNPPASAETLAAVEAFLAAGSPPVVFTLGTAAVEAAGSFYEVSAAAIRRLGLRAIMLVGRHAHNRPSPVDDRVLAVDYAPHADLFPRASVIVHQGGAGTAHQALAAGRPMLVVPHAHDQPDNAHRLARLGVARVLYPGKYSVDAVAGELVRLLKDRTRQVRAAELGLRVRGENGARAAAQALDDLLAAGAPPIHA